MRIPLSELPEGVTAACEGRKAWVSIGEGVNRQTFEVDCDGEAITLYTDRAYRHADLARALGR